MRELMDLIEMARFRYQMKTWSPYNGCHKSLNTDPEVTITKRRGGGWQLAWGEYIATESSYSDALSHVDYALRMGDQFVEPIALISTPRKPPIVEALKPYPTRRGNTPAAYRQFILDIMNWKQQKNGNPNWDGNVGDDLSKSGIKVAQQMEQEGIVQVSLTDNRAYVRRGGPRTGTPERTDNQYFQGFTISPGPNFLRTSTMGESRKSKE